MSRRDKQLAKLADHNSDKNWTLDEISELLLGEGWSLRAGKGSHKIFRPISGPARIVLGSHGKTVKPVYIREIRGKLIPTKPQ